MEIEEIYTEYYEAMGWDTKTGKPLKETLHQLGMESVARELYK